MTRRDVLRLLCLSSVTALAAACQLSLPPLPPGVESTPGPADTYPAATDSRAAD